MARVLKWFHSFTCTPIHSSTVGMSHTCLCLPSHSWYSIPTWRDGRLNWPGWDSLPARRQSPIPLLTRLNVEQLCWSRPTHYCYTKPLPSSLIVAQPMGNNMLWLERKVIWHCTGQASRTLVVFPSAASQPWQGRWALCHFLTAVLLP